MFYKHCSICGAELIEKDGELGCTKCSYVNYNNPRPTATALILFDNKLLLTKRDREPFKGQWDLPGGFVDRGETPEEAIIREIKEETDLDIKIKNQFGIYAGTCLSDFGTFYVVSVVYLAESPTEEVKALDDVCESKWFDKKDLPEEIAFDSNQEIIHDFLKIWN